MNKFNPDIHHRRSIRLKHYDYSQGGAYFVTMCAGRRECLFGEIENGEMRMNGFGGIVRACWADLPQHYQHVELDAFVVMPNHFHGIIVINDVGAGLPRPETNNIKTMGAETAPLQLGRETLPLRKHSLGQIMGYLKYQSTKQINESRGNPGCPVWQRNYYDHIIRNDEELNRVREYIVYNPARWVDDENNPANIK